MISALHSAIDPNFFVDYFKDMVLVALVIIYFVVFALTRPHIVKEESRGRRATEAAAAAKVLER